MDSPSCAQVTACVIWLCSQNIDDALAKLQEMVDAAVDSVTVKEADPETIKKIEKRYGEDIGRWCLWKSLRLSLGLAMIRTDC